MISTSNQIQRNGNKRKAERNEQQNAPNAKRDKNNNQNIKNKNKKRNFAKNRRHNNARQPLQSANYYQQNTLEFYQPPVSLMSLKLAPLYTAAQIYQQPAPAIAEVKQEVQEDNKHQHLLSLMQSLYKSGLLEPTTRTEADIWNALTLPNLKIWNQKTVDEIVKKRPDCCTMCSFKFPDDTGKSEAAKDHMDTHVKAYLNSLFTSKTSKACVRPWYKIPKKKYEVVASGSQTLGAQEIAEDVKSEGLKTTNCTICAEKFEDYYDDEEETWRFKNTTEKNGQIVHRQCAAYMDDVDDDIFILPQ